MIPLIACAAIGVLIGIFLAYDEAVGPIEGFFFAAFGGVLGGLVGFIAALIIGAFAYQGVHWEEKERVPLVSLADTSKVHGSFFLGSGYVDQEPSFTWYEQAGENNYVRKDALSYESTIHYLGKGETPRYVRSETVPNEKFWNTWGWGSASGGEYHYDFYIPKGSIVQSYKLDNR